MVKIDFIELINQRGFYHGDTEKEYIRATFARGSPLCFSAKNRQSRETAKENVKALRARSPSFSITVQTPLSGADKETKHAAMARTARPGFSILPAAMACGAGLPGRQP
jgi:hypothetical protein